MRPALRSSPPQVPLSRAGVRLALAALAMAACNGSIRAYPEEFAGVGVELHDAQDGPHVLRPLPGSAAELAGLKAGDRVVAVDGLPTAGRSLADVVSRLRGPPGSQVSIILERGAVRMTVDLTRTAVARAGDDYQARAPATATP